MSNAPVAAPPVTATVDQRMILTIALRETAALGARATVMLDDSNGRGLVTIIGDSDTWSYYWPRGHRGEDTLARFLLQCDQGYLTSKFAPTRSYDGPRTRASLIRRLLEARHERASWTYAKPSVLRNLTDETRAKGEIDAKERVREAYDALKASDEDSDSLLRAADIIPDAWENISMVPNRSFTRFYKMFWETVRVELKKL